MPLLWLSLAFLAGILLAKSLALSTTIWLMLIGVSLILSVIQLVLQRRGGRYPILSGFNLQPFSLNLPLSILLYVIFLGAVRFQDSIPALTDPGFIAAHNDSDQQMMVTGVVANMPDVRDRFTYLRVETERMHTAGELDYVDVNGMVLVSTPPGKEYSYGDRVVIRGYLETPPEAEDFSYREYLARQGVYTLIPWAKVSILETGQGSWFRSLIYNFKGKALATAYRLWPDPEASLFAGIILGVETGIPEPVQQAFEESGTTHVIAISGFNIAIISGLFVRLFGRLLGPYKGALAAVAAISIYTVLVGAEAPVVRAALMGGLALAAGLVGRRQVGYHALAVVAAVMAWDNPHVLWDVGFQLSFGATLGLVLYADPLADGFIRLASHWLPEEIAESLAGPVGEFFLFTFAAQVTTLPILAFHFGTFSWVAFLANPVILPVQPPIMILGGVSLILGLVWFPLGRLLAFSAWPFVLFTIRAVEFFADSTVGALSLGEFSFGWVFLYYALLLVVTFGWTGIRDWTMSSKDRLQSAALVPAVALLGVLTVAVFRAAMTAPDGNLHLTLLEVGTGDAVLIQSPEGRYILINGGPSTNALADSLGRRLPPFHRQLDWFVVASANDQQIAALPRLVDRYPPAKVLWAGYSSPSRQADYLREALAAKSVPVLNVVPGHSLDLGRGAQLSILTVGNRGAVLLLEWNLFRMLLPLGLNDGDLESLRMGADIGPVSSLVLAENGYSPANPAAWINNLKPQVVLLSVAPDDRDGLPDPETLEALEGYTLLRTDQNGWIQITTDGQQMWLNVER